MKYGKLNIGQIEAIVNNLGGMEGVEKFLRGEITVSETKRAWREQDGVIYFSVTSDGTIGEEWIKRLKSKGFYITETAKRMLRSPHFSPTNGVTIEVAILKGTIFKDDDRIMGNVYAEAKKRKLMTPNVEVACLIREKFMGEEIEAMGLSWIVVVHEPIKGSDGEYPIPGSDGEYPSLLNVQHDSVGRWLSTCHSDPRTGWSRETGLAFVSQTT